MARVKGGNVSKNRRRKVLKQAKGYFGSKHRLYKTAQEQLFHSGEYAYRDRKQNKRNFRKLWITRINAGCRQNNISYSKFINGLNKAGITINRKMLSELAINDPAAFTNLCETSKDKTMSDIAREYGITRACITQWRKKYGTITTSTGEVTNNDEILKLKKELQQVQMENDILKKVVAIFSKK